MMWTGRLERPHSYGPDAGAEARSVHHAVGLIDVSRSGSCSSPGLRRARSSTASTRNRFSDLKVGAGSATAC